MATLVSLGMARVFARSEELPDSPDDKCGVERNKEM
jgi:hypothetical protein